MQKQRKCQIGWIDSLSFESRLDWNPGKIPGSERARLAWEQEVVRRIIAESYSDMEDLTVCVMLDDYDEEGAEITVYVRWQTDSLPELLKNASRAICEVPAGHAYDFLVDRARFHEDDFEPDGTPFPATLARLTKMFAK